MKKLLLSLSVIVLFAFYSLFQKKTAPGSIGLDTTSNNIIGSGTTLSPQVTYKDGVYVGQVADAYYGNVQVQTTIQKGKITDVSFLQYPNDRNRSIAINTQAMPDLKQETIAAQSSNVDIISGATATSQAFVASLESALSQAR
jgi:uncharacterized protein with FMN-binding domain